MSMQTAQSPAVTAEGGGDPSAEGHLKKPRQDQDHGDVGEAADESFPASDPPSFNAGDAGDPEEIPPGQHGEPEPHPEDPKKRE